MLLAPSAGSRGGGFVWWGVLGFSNVFCFWGCFLCCLRCVCVLGVLRRVPFAWLLFSVGALGGRLGAAWLASLFGALLGRRRLACFGRCGRLGGRCFRRTTYGTVTRSFCLFRLRVLLLPTSRASVFVGSLVGGAVWRWLSVVGGAVGSWCRLGVLFARRVFVCLFDLSSLLVSVLGGGFPQHRLKIIKKKPHESKRFLGFFFVCNPRPRWWNST